MHKGICITGLDGNFATHALLTPLPNNKTQVLLQFDDPTLCHTFLQRNLHKMFTMQVSLNA